MGNANPEVGRPSHPPSSEPSAHELKDGASPTTFLVLMRKDSARGDPGDLLGTAIGRGTIREVP